MTDGVQITKRYVASLEPAATGKDEFHWDKNLPGFGVRVQATGASSYVVKYRPGHGRQVTPKRVTLGSTTKLTPDYARTLAKKLLGQVANGADPARERREAARKAKTAAATSLKAVAETYLTQACGMLRDANGKAFFNGKLRSADQRLGVFERLVYPDAIAKRHIGEIGRGDIAAFLGRIEVTRGPRMAHVTLAYMSALFNWYAARSEFRSPIVRGMSPIKPAERARTRILSEREIRDVWAALDKPTADTDIPPCFARLVRTLLLTGLRRAEAARASWGEIDYLRHDDFQGDVLTIPAARMKGKLDHAVPLTRRVLALLGERPRYDVKARPFVFSVAGRKTAFRNYAAAKAALDAEIARSREADGREPMPQWQLHDLRRTAKTLMQRAGVRPDISERVLAHAIGGVEGVYDRYGYLPEKLDALTKLDAIVERILRTIDW